MIISRHVYYAHFMHLRDRRLRKVWQCDQEYELGSYFARVKQSQLCTGEITSLLFLSVSHFKMEIIIYLYASQVAQS